MLCNGNVECIHAQDKANMFNSYFASVFIDDSEAEFPEYNGEEVSPIDDPYFTVDDVILVLKSLNQNKACAPADISHFCS